MGQNAFVSKYAPRMGAKTAAMMYEKASQASATAMNILVQYAPSLNGIGMTVLPYATPQSPGIPNWESLFGAADFCDCEHCRSVYSPAAYFVDVLAWLKDRPSRIANKSAKDILFLRRPDLGEIELSCDNTNTPLPYVDLVNEVLENAVSPGTALPARQRQTSGAAAELEANPQYTNPGAYEVLRKAVFPWELPFDLWLEESRAYLGHLGVQRSDLMTALKGATPSVLEIESEVLGLSTVERKIVTGAALNPARQPWEFYGYPNAAPGTWLNDLKKARALLKASDLTYDELVRLLRQRFVNPNGTLTIISSDAADPEHRQPGQARDRQP